MKILEQHKKKYDSQKHTSYKLEQFLALVKKDPSIIKSPAERLLAAIGEPVLVDTAKDAKLSRIFGNRKIRTYEAFSDFYGLEETIEKIVSFLVHSSQGLEESRQILYFLGPVGSAKSSLAERLKQLIEQEPIYVLVDKDHKVSPIHESPLGLFSTEDAKLLGVDERYLTLICSPWATKRVKEYDGDLSQFIVYKMYPSQLKQIAVSKTEPGDDTNQDISTLVGKLDLRKIEYFSQNDPDCYKFSGGLCLANQGLMEFVEMFKAPIKVLNPLLTATQERKYKGTEAISEIPFDGVIIAHSNESEWDSFKNDKKNEAFLDRVCIIEVPYCLRVTEEIKIYKKLLKSSTLADAPIAPLTLRMLASMCVLTRITPPSNGGALTTKMAVYDGQNAQERDNKAKSIQEYRDMATYEEGFSGFSTRLAYKVLAEVYNFDTEEIAADPVHLLCVLERTIKRLRFSEEVENHYLSIITDYLSKQYAQKIGKHIHTCYIESYAPYGQALFDRYVLYADHWIENNDYRDPDTGAMFDREMLNKELEKIEKAAEIVNPKDFREEITRYCLKHQATHGGENPKWNAYAKLHRVIEQTLFSTTKDLIPVLSFDGKGTEQDQKKHKDFVERMCKLGYTERQVRRLEEWHRRVSQNS